MYLTQLANKTSTFIIAPQEIPARLIKAEELIDIGQYEEACDALGDLWHGIGQRPATEELSDTDAPQLLLVCGTLSSALGSTRGMGGEIQTTAKDLISEARRHFLQCENITGVAAADYEISLCYWWLGEYDEARIILAQAADEIAATNNELRAKILIRRTLCEIWQCRYHDAWTLLQEAEPLFENCSDAVKGRWHGQRALVLRRLANAENRSDYADRAIIEFTAAIVNYEVAGHERHCATNLNNLGMLLYRLGRYGEAQANLLRARAIFMQHADEGNIAQVDDSRALVFLAQKENAKAEQVISSAVQVFERADESALLANALTTLAKAEARNGKPEASLAHFRRAIASAEVAGALESAGNAALSLVEEHGNTRLSVAELHEYYGRADNLLRDSEDAEDLRRLRASARLIIQRCQAGDAEVVGSPDFSLQDAVREYESQFIREALKQSAGSVSRAAKMLGFSHHSCLASLLKTRHVELLPERIPAVPRRRSIIRFKQEKKSKRQSATK